MGLNIFFMHIEPKYSKKDRKDMIQYINLQLAALGQPLFYDHDDAKIKYSNSRFISLTEDLIKSFKEKYHLFIRKYGFNPEIENR